MDHLRGVRVGFRIRAGDVAAGVGVEARSLPLRDGDVGARAKYDWSGVGLVGAGSTGGLREVPTHQSKSHL